MVKEEEKCIKLSQYTFFRTANHLPAWILCVSSAEEMVGAVLLPALARHYCHLSQGPAGGGTGERTSGGEDDEKDCHQILPPGLHPLHQEVVLQA